MLKPASIFTLVCLLLCFPANAQKPASRPATPNPQAMARTVPVPLEPKEILQREKPGIVSITSVDAKGQPFAMGSGFVVRSNGVVITNYHVIRGASDAQIKLQTGEIYENVYVLDFDARRDIVVLKIRAADLPTVTLGDSSAAEPGDRAYAIGNPEGLDYTISDGLVSARRMIEGTEMLQISVPISHGSSGGPLYNTSGQVIGITAAGVVEEGAQNLNFAVPIKYVLLMLDSPPRNITLAQLTDMRKGLDSPPESKEQPATSSSEKPSAAPASGGGEFDDPDGWMSITFPGGWTLKNPPPEGLLFEASNSDNCTLGAWHSDSNNAEAEFDHIRKVSNKQFGKMSAYSDKIKIDHEDDRHFRIQTFQVISDSTYVMDGALQHGSRVVGLLGACSSKDDYDKMVDAIETISY